MKAGTEVKAFHPAMFGVIKQGVVRKQGSKFIYIDFGDLNGGVHRVLPKDIVEVIDGA